MADEPGGATPGGRGFWPDWLTPRRIWEFLSNVARLERQVQRLQAENEALSSELSQMRTILTDHDARLQLLTSFVRDSLSNRLEGKIDRLAAELLAQRHGRKDG